MIRPFDGKMPKIANTAFVSESAYVIGNVEIGENSGVWPGAVIRADFGLIKIGNNTQIEDNSVLHTGGTLEIGNNVTIGHGVVVHGLRIGDNALIGNNATILDFAEIGELCIVSANSVVGAGQKIPDNSFVAGNPAEIKQSSPEEIKKILNRMVERYTRMGIDPLIELDYSNLIKKYKEQGL